VPDLGAVRAGGRGAEMEVPVCGLCPEIAMRAWRKC